MLNNQDLNQVTWEMRILSGNPENVSTQQLPDFPYAAFGESLGFKGIRVKSPEDVERGWRDALSADRPVVFEAVTSGNVATLPPHISMKQAENFLNAARQGDPQEGGMLKESIKQIFAGVIPHKTEEHVKRGE